MTTEPSPGQGASQEDFGWAFRPRESAPAPFPGQEAPQADEGWAFRPRRSPAAPQPYGQPQPYGRPQRPEQPTPTDGRAAAAPYGDSSGRRWDSTVPLRLPEPRSGAHGAADEPDRPTPPHSRRGGRGRKPRWRGRAVLALAVIAAMGGAAAVMLEQQDAAAVAPKNLTQAWHIPAPAADDALIGSWLTDKLLVRAGSRGGLRAYDLADGKQMWRVAPGATGAERGTVPCAMSPTLSAKGIGTVAFGKDAGTCTRLAGVDASTGKILWSVPLTNAEHPAAAAASTYLQGDVATVVSENFLGGVDVRTGNRVWGYKARGHYCNAYDWGADGVVLVADFCLDRKNRFTLTAYDGRTGKAIWRKAESAHSDVTHILSVSPLVAAVHTARQDAVRVLGTTGTGRKLAVGDNELTPGNHTDADHSARLYSNVLVTPALSSGSAVIDGYDTTTGAKLWTRRSAALAVPPSGADGKVYAVTTSGSPQLITIDPRTGRTTPVAALTAGTGKGNFTSGTVYVTPDGGVLELDALGPNGGVRLYR